MSKEVLERIKEDQIDYVDLRYTAANGAFFVNRIPTRGNTYHIEKALAEGSVVSTDMLDERLLGEGEKESRIIADPDTYFETPFYNQTQGKQKYKTATIIGDIHNFDGGKSKICARTAYKSALDEIEYDHQIGAEIEFYLKDARGKLSHLSVPEFLLNTENPRDKRVVVRDTAAMNLIDMGIDVNKVHKESANYQQEIVLNKMAGLHAADMFMMTTGRVLPDTATEFGYASVMSPKPKQHLDGNGIHLNMSLTNEEGNLFTGQDGQLSSEALMFGQGVLGNTALLNFFLNRSLESYNRFNGLMAPGNVSMGISRHDLVRTPDNQRVEVRLPDASMNIYLALTAILKAGMYGMDGQTGKHQFMAKSLSDANNIMKNALTGGESEVLGVPREIIEILIADNERRIELSQVGVFGTVGQKLNKGISDLRERFR